MHTESGSRRENKCCRNFSQRVSPHMFMFQQKPMCYAAPAPLFAAPSCMRSTQDLCMSVGTHSRLHWMSRRNSTAYADAWKCTLPRYKLHRAAEQPGSMTLLQKTQAHLVRAHKREQLQRDGHSGRRPYSPTPNHSAAEAVNRDVKERPKRAGLRATGAVELARRNSPPTRRLHTLLTSHAKLAQQQHGCSCSAAPGTVGEQGGRQRRPE